MAHGCAVASWSPCQICNIPDICVCKIPHPFYRQFKTSWLRFLCVPMFFQLLSDKSCGAFNTVFPQYWQLLGHNWYIWCGSFLSLRWLAGCSFCLVHAWVPGIKEPAQSISWPEKKAAKLGSLASSVLS